MHFFSDVFLLYMSSHKFYVGESFISRIISHFNFPLLCQNLSPKIILSLRYSISSELWEPLNKRIYTEESRTYYATPITSLLYTNHVILTRVFTIMMLNILRRNKNFHPSSPPIIPFDAVTPTVKPARITEGLLKLLRTDCRYVDTGICGLNTL